MRRGDTRRLVLAAATAAGLALAGVAGGATWTPSLVSTGDEPGNGAFDAGVVAVSPDATRILFSTPEPLLAADGDASPDVYLRTGGVTSLLTDGPLAPPVRLLASATSGRIAFATAEALAAGADNDTAVDVYLRDGTATTLVSANPPAGNASTDVTLLAISADGTRIIFATSEALDTTSDTDTRADVYVYELGAATPLTHVSSGAVNGDGPFDVTFQATSDDGSRILFQTAEPLEAGDTDGSVADLYQWSAGVTTLVSGNGVPASPADSPVLSRDGTRVLFRTEEQLTGGDTDSLHDVYVWSSGVTSLVTGPGVTDIGASFPVAFSADGSRAYVRSVDQLLSADVDNAYDLYEWSGGTLRLLSPGPGVGASEPTFLAAADDGSHVLFATAEQLAAADTDVRLDVYERTATATTLVSAGGTGVDDIDTALVSADGSRAFFVTSEQLVAEDTDTALDVYERSAGETRLVSVGGGTGNVDLAAVSADGSRAVLTTGLSLVPADTEARADVYLATLEPDPPPSSPPPAPAAPPPAPPPPPPAPPSAATSEAVRAGAARPVRYRLTMDAAGAVRMRLICVGRPRATCAGTVRLTTRNRQLRQVLIGRGSFSFTKPAKPQLTIVLTPAGRRLVREGAQRQAVLVVSTRVPGAKPSAFSATVTLVRARAQAARGSPGAARERSPGLG